MITIDGGTGIILHNGTEVASPKMVDQFHLNSDWTTNESYITGTVFTRVSSSYTGAASQIGSGMTYTSGDGSFSFPSTGKYLIMLNMNGRPSANDNVYLYISTTTDNSTYTQQVKAQLNSSAAGKGKSGSQMYFFDVTNTSTHKVKLYASSIGSGSRIEGSDSGGSAGSREVETNIVFQKLGET